VEGCCWVNGWEWMGMLVCWYDTLCDVVIIGKMGFVLVRGIVSFRFVSVSLSFSCRLLSNFLIL
jgi:hypothetical protein